MSQRMLELLMHGVSTRNYKGVIPQMAQTTGISRSSVSRKARAAAEAEVEKLLSRRFEGLDLLVIYVDGLVFGEHTMIGAVGVDSEGNKHVLGLREGATENSTVVTALLEEIVARGVDHFSVTQRHHLALQRATEKDSRQDHSGGSATGEFQAREAARDDATALGHRHDEAEGCRRLREIRGAKNQVDRCR